VTLPAVRSVPGNGSCTLTVEVTAAVGGSYINTLLAGALVTTNGSNAGPAVAALTVVALVPPPTLGKAFSPATINAGEVSTLTITMSNPGAMVATLTAALIDSVPSGVVIAATPEYRHDLWRGRGAGGGRRWLDGELAGGPRDPG